MMASIRWGVILGLLLYVELVEGDSMFLPRTLQKSRGSSKPVLARPRKKFNKLRNKGKKALSVTAMADLDDSEEEILTTLGITLRASWLALVWSIPVLLSPLAIVFKPFRVSLWYPLLALALAKSGTSSARTLHSNKFYSFSNPIPIYASDHCGTCKILACVRLLP